MHRLRQLGILLSLVATFRADGVLVFAPHPDDEALCCSGVMIQALQQGKPVQVVLITNGDGFTHAAAGLTKKPYDKVDIADYLAISRFRQNQTLAATKLLGVKRDAVIMLGYPNPGLAEMYAATGDAPFTQQFTHKSETYALVQQDYHTAAHGKPAPYTRASVLADMAEIIRKFQPGQIYVTDQADGHPDHRTSFFFVRDAIKAAGYQGEFYTYLIHNGAGHQWPWPHGVTPRAPFASHAVNGETIPRGIAWPPTKRVPLTASQAEVKLKAIRAHTLYFPDPAENESHQANMESFVKSEEVFWNVTDARASR
jgi:LmbE family N-acetylglucosaminyl deacetylase